MARSAGCCRRWGSRSSSLLAVTWATSAATILTDEDRSHTKQLIGSLVVAALIVVVAVLVVTAKFGPTSVAELDAREERQDAREERLEERREAIEERRENR